MSTKLTPKQTRVFDEALNRADASNDVKTKTDADGKYIRTPWALCEEIVGQIVAQTSLRGKKILVVDTVEFIPVLLTYGAEKRNITYVAPYEYKGMIASAVGVRVVQQNLLEWKPDMKFDVVIGNPPYNKGMLKGSNVKAPGGYPHLYFINKCQDHLNNSGVISFVMPTGLMTLHSLQQYRQTLLKQGRFKSITIYNNSKKKYFNIDKFDNVMSFIFVKGSHGDTLIRRENFKFSFNETTINLSDYNFWPMYFNEISRKIFEKVQAKRTGNISYLKGEETPYYISFAVMGDSNTFTHTKLWQLNSSNSKIAVLVKLFFSSAEEAQLYFEFTKTPFFNFLLCMVKSTPKNQPQFVNHIGKFNFTNNDFYQHFGLTQEEINYIEATIK